MNWKRLAAGASLLTICLTLALLVLTFFAIGHGDTPENPFTTIGVVLELFFAVLTTSTFISVLLASHTRRKFRYYFLWMLVLNTVGLLSDVLYWGIGLSFLPNLPLIQELGYHICYATAFPLLIFYSTYLISYINDDPDELHRYAMLVAGLSADGFLLVIISFFTACSPVDPWRLADNPWLYFFFLALPMVVIVMIIFSFRKTLRNRRALSFLFFELLIAGTVVFDTIIGEVTFAYAVTAFSLLLVYVTVQIDYEKEQEEQLVQQRIAIMLSQIQPHFLYNVLTSIRALCRSDAHSAERALTDFTLYLRANLDSLNAAGCIPFLKELEHTKHYVDLEKMRFGKDLTVLFNTPVTQFSLPPLTLEPIVENAVRHGVMHRRSGGTVIISTGESAESIHITVADDGVGFEVSSLSTLDESHIGLHSVRKRLAGICGGRLDVESSPGVGTTITLTLPKDTKEES